MSYILIIPDTTLILDALKKPITLNPKKDSVHNKPVREDKKDSSAVFEAPEKPETVDSNAEVGPVIAPSCYIVKLVVRRSAESSKLSDVFKELGRLDTETF
ncbi:hypothetical protein KIN20_033634 [Parelaphostrongylus tenuis]|uniref:Uncharacterized protein n=1 Tax=Parelaphostrongylus tenuis TaxID=148309 RepID=A0AAD5R8R9_PARTN|nr:hypothetical protein KIN20_033634 [Parelaphostrongylus tenuis]